MLSDRKKHAFTVVAGLALGFFGSSVSSSIWSNSDRENDGGIGEAQVITFNDERTSSLMQDLATNRILYIGETHNRLDHHLNQLKIIKSLNEKGIDFAIGLESFQRPYQHHLDDYVNGNINEKMLLKSTGYYEKWGYDFRLYRMVMSYARDNDIPLIALNAPTELVEAVSSKGLVGLDDRWNAQLPEFLISPEGVYENRLKSAFSNHPVSGNGLDRFMQVQMLWDEYMAESLVSYLTRHPGRKMVVLAGSGHVAGGHGIPVRVNSRLPVKYKILLNADPDNTDVQGADYLLISQGYELPVVGRLGFYLTEDSSGVTVKDIKSASSSYGNSILPGDRILHIAGDSIDSIEDVKLAMLDRQPGEQVWIELERTSTGVQPSRVAAVVELN